MKILILLITLSLMSCSTLKKSMIYPAIGGVVIGGLGGHTLSDEDKGEDKGANAAIYAGVGALIGAGLGYLLYKDHPDNKKLTHAMDVTPPLKLNNQKSHDDFLLGKSLKKEFRLKAVNENVIPENLKSKLKKPRVKIYEIPERVINKDGKELVIEKTKGYEYVIE